MKKRIILLGSTGSIGENTLEIVRRFPDQFEIISLVAHLQWEKLANQIQEFKPQKVALFDPDAAISLRKVNPACSVLTGTEGILEILDTVDCDILVNAIVGMNGLIPTWHAVGRIPRIALANKESLVMGGALLKERFRQANGHTELLPVDSEHSAIFQCLAGQDTALKKIILTASGGPFYFSPEIDLFQVKPEQALKHPTWQMGAKISIDSATLVNKGLEIIEAAFLFNLSAEQIEVLIHPQSYIHSLVEFVDGSQIAQMSRPDMKIPIQYALTYPYRWPSTHINPPLWQMRDLQFFEPDLQRFPALRMAFNVLQDGHSAQVAFNSSNEIAVERFLNREIAFGKIPIIIEKSIEQFTNRAILDLNDLLNLDQEIRTFARLDSTCV